MKINKFIFTLFISFLIGISFATGTNYVTNPPYVVDVNYDFSNNYHIDGTIYKTDSILLRVTTTIGTICKYGESSTSHSTSFDGDYGFTHEVYIDNLHEGLHTYYVECGDNSSTVMEINFATSIPIYGEIEISGNPSSLKGGKYKIYLTTSETSLETPTLKYSFDNIVEKSISLTGSGQNWIGNLIIPESIGEAICSFKFSAKDLSGIEGNKIIGENLFVVDTIKPSAIEVITAISYDGQIKLNWFSEEEVDNFNIYRSEDSQVEYTDLYEVYDISTKNYFYDNEVEKGTTYYYRIAGVDEAGNIGELSKEIYATALLNNYSKKSGLNPSLVGTVDNLIVEISSVTNNIDNIKSLMELKAEEERNLYTEIKLDKDLSDALSELNSLKRDVENYKLQDLSEEELNKKISSSNLKLNIIKKKIPEDITIIESKQIERIIDEEDIQRMFLEYFSSYGEYDYKKEASETLKIIQEGRAEIKSNFYILDIMYLDGTKNRVTLILDIINSNIKDTENVKFIINIPKEIAETTSELKIMNLEYETIKEDPIISFNSETKKIVYYIDKEIDLDSLEEILISPLNLPDIKTEENSKITGNFILNNGSGGSLGLIVLIFISLLFSIYFLKVKRDSSIGPILKIMEDIKKVKELLKRGEEKEGRELYKEINDMYKTLRKEEKVVVMELIKKMNEEVSR